MGDGTGQQTRPPNAGRVGPGVGCGHCHRESPAAAAGRGEPEGVQPRGSSGDAGAGLRLLGAHAPAQVRAGKGSLVRRGVGACRRLSFTPAPLGAVATRRVSSKGRVCPVQEAPALINAQRQSPYLLVDICLSLQPSAGLASGPLPHAGAKRGLERHGPKVGCAWPAGVPPGKKPSVACFLLRKAGPSSEGGLSRRS